MRDSILKINQSVQNIGTVIGTMKKSGHQYDAQTIDHLSDKLNELIAKLEWKLATNNMTKENLSNLIILHFKSKRAFISRFNAQGGQLEETVLSAQLKGRRGLSAAWRSAYAIFFYHLAR